MNVWIIRFLLWVAVLPACLGAHGKYAQKLLKDLFANYSSALRPVEDTDNVINITMQITLSQIIDMDERNQILTTYLWIRQVWIDAFLTWKAEDYDGLDTIRIPSGYVWRPDIVLYNNADNQFSGSMETNVVLRYDGQVMWDLPAIAKSTCRVDVSYFPFDTQQCGLTFGSWTYDGNQMDLYNAQDGANLSDFLENVEWVLLGMPAKRNVILYGCCSDPYPDITYTVHLKRRASFYIYNLLIPCLMISFLAPLGFYLPADSDEKVSLGVTLLLALTVFQLLVAESMPPSENVPLIGKYYIATMIIITASTALTIFIMAIHHCGLEARPVPLWARKFILEYMARICFVYSMGENCLTAQTDRLEPPSLPAMGAGWANIQAQGKVLRGKAGSKQGGDAGAVGFLRKNLSNCFSTWRDGAFKSLDQSKPVGMAGGGGGRSEGCKVHCLCHQELLQRKIKYISTCYRDQRASQAMSGQWKKVAKVMDRFFMWIFFIMVLFLSVLIMSKAI